MILGSPPVAIGAMPDAVFENRLSGDLMLALEGAVLFRLQAVVVEDVQGVIRGLCASPSSERA